ncbi:hypothetical protein BDD21_0868 [Thiocapsa rosea]|uniref:Uncharacterized protein n=1 Tax=Thiocapsa rosea TaxID=69360 RepID=A0A495V282_9GAMM|nr:hypothetical protein BDD21_0868 [Thiocapsa rosea]
MADLTESSCLLEEVAGTHTRGEQAPPGVRRKRLVEAIVLAGRDMRRRVLTELGVMKIGGKGSQITRAGHNQPSLARCGATRPQRFRGGAFRSAIPC